MRNKKYIIPKIEGEFWVDIQGWEGYYSVSNKLRIKRNEGYRGKSFYPEKLITPRLTSYGYYEVVFTVNNKRGKYFWHRVVAIAFIPNSENKPEVNHKNGNRADYSIDNLEWTTRSENQLHKTRILMSGSGENHPNAKLSSSDILNIHNLYKTGKYSQRKISEMYRLNNATVYKILRGIIWSDFAKEKYNIKRVRRTNAELIKAV